MLSVEILKYQDAAWRFGVRSHIAHTEVYHVLTLVACVCNVRPDPVTVNSPRSELGSALVIVTSTISPISPAGPGEIHDAVVFGTSGQFTRVFSGCSLYQHRLPRTRHASAYVLRLLVDPGLEQLQALFFSSCVISSG